MQPKFRGCIDYQIFLPMVLRCARELRQKVMLRSSPQFSLAKWLSFCDETRTVTPRFYMCFLLVMATQKYIFRRKNLDSRSFIFVRYEWHEFPHLEPQSLSTMIKLHFSIFFSKSGNLRCLNWKNIAQTKKWT